MPSSSFRILITGGEGFVGRHLVRALQNLPEAPEIIVGTIDGVPRHGDTARSIALDVTDAERVRKVIAAERPTHLFHLAAISTVAVAQKNIRRAWEINFGGTLNIAIGLSEAVPDCRLFYCSSAEVYGMSFQVGRPLDESALLDPITAYGASKAAADILVGQMARRGLRAIRLRPFNHTGPGQSEQFVVPAFASQIVRIERGEQDPVINVGSLSSRRDFLDVRDVVDAYVRAILRFDELPPGCVINVASGNAIRISEILDTFLSLSNKRIDIVENKELLRTSDMPVMIGDASRARQLLGWAPRINLSDTLNSILDSYRGHSV